MQIKPRTYLGSSPAKKSDDYMGFRFGHERTPGLLSAIQGKAYDEQLRRYRATKCGSPEAKVELKKLRAMKTC